MPRERQPVGVAHHRHDQPAFGADGDADVVVLLVDDLVALDLGVELRERAQRRDGGLDEERRDAEADAVRSLNASLRRSRSAITAVMSTSLKVVSIAAVRCASTRRRAMVARRLRHAHALLAARIAGLRGGRWREPGRTRRALQVWTPARLARPWARRAARRWPFCTSCFITRPARPCPDAAEIHVVLLGHAPGRRRGACLVGAAIGPAARRAGAARLPVLAGAASAARQPRQAPPRGGCAAPSLDHAEHLADLDVLALLPLDAGEHAADFRRSLRGRSSRFRARRPARRPRRGRLPASATCATRASTTDSPSCGNDDVRHELRRQMLDGRY